MGNRRNSDAARSVANLLPIADLAFPFTSADGQAFVRLKYRSGGFFVLPVRSQAFRNWFFAEYYRQRSILPTRGAYHAILQHLEAQAADDPRHTQLTVWRRIGARGPSRIPSRILLDLANPDGQMVEISPTGWNVVTNTTASFQTSRSTFDLPQPQQPEGSPAAVLESLRSHLNLADRADWLRCLAWLISAFFPSGPFPVLILRGPTGSGKSTAARLLRYLIDPSSAPLTPIPHNPGQLLNFARHNWILAFDHISALSTRLTDALCRLASGAGISIREALAPDPTRDPVLHHCRRPVILTATDLK